MRDMVVSFSRVRSRPVEKRGLTSNSATCNNLRRASPFRISPLVHAAAQAVLFASSFSFFRFLQFLFEFLLIPGIIEP
jgi:hypothetical protein